MERFVLLEERLNGLFEYLYSTDAARRALLIVPPMSGFGDRWYLGSLEVPV